MHEVTKLVGKVFAKNELLGEPLAVNPKHVVERAVVAVTWAVDAAAALVAPAVVAWAFLRKGQLNRHTRYRPATTTRNTATQWSRRSVD